MARIFLVRHGQTNANVVGRIQGWLDEPLDSTGLAQADAVARRLARIAKGSQLVSSDLARAWRTAEAIGIALGAEPVSDSRLREMQWGDWEGLSREEIKIRFPDEYARYSADPTQRPSSAETVEAFWTRIERFIESQDLRRDAIWVGHGGSVRACAAQLLGGGLPLYYGLRSDNGAISIIEAGARRRTLLLFNDASHLEAPPAESSALSYGSEPSAPNPADD